MSKLREHVQAAPSSADIEAPPTGDLHAFVVFTQLKRSGPYIYAGWLDAPDERLAMTLAREHYGRDQVCTGLWLAPREFIGGLRENRMAEQQPVSSPRDYQIFTQRNAGDQHISAERISARSAAEAIARARAIVPATSMVHNLWAIPLDEIIATQEGELVWRLTDQSYRLARGYSKSVREKWEQIRGAEKTEEYEKEDLKETF